MKRTLLTTLFSLLGIVALFGQTISSVFPDSTYQGNTVTVTITGAGVNFNSSTGASQVRLTGPGNINSTAVSIISNTVITAQFNISPIANPGIYTMEVPNYTNSVPGIFEVGGIPPSQQTYLVKGKVYFG